MGDFDQIMASCNGIEGLVGELSKGLAELLAEQDLPKTLDGTELELWKSSIQCRELEEKLSVSRARFDSLRHHYAKLRVKQLEDKALADAKPVATEEQAPVAQVETNHEQAVGG